MTVSRALLRLYHWPANWVSWIVFGGVGVTLNVVCALMLPLPNRVRRGPAVRATIQKLFGAWCAWLHATRLIYVTWTGFTPKALDGAAVYVSNHPGLLDATFVLARLPDTICIFKPAIMRNPALGPAALMGGYVSGDTGLDLIRDVAERLQDGRSLLIFPEGTRTAADVNLNPLKPGFALIASRARVPVRLVVIRAPRDLVPKGWPWWRPPQFPAHVNVALLGDLVMEPGESALDTAARATQLFEQALAAS